MRHLIANALQALAGPSPTGIRVLFAAMAREANLSLLTDLGADRMARASFIEGLLGYKPGTLLRNPGILSEAAGAIESDSENSIVSGLRSRGLSPKDIEALLGGRNTQLWLALFAGIRKGVPQSGIRGLSQEGILTAIGMGISPLNNDPLPSFQGGNMFWHTGHTAKGSVSMGGLASILRKRGMQHALSILRGTSKAEQSQVQSDSPLGDDAGNLIGDTFSGESAVSRADYVEMASAIFQDRRIMDALNRAMLPLLKGPSQEAVWDAVRENPHLIRINGDKVGIDATELTQLLGGEVSAERVGQVWRQKVWPAMLEAFRDSGVAKSLLRNRQIMDIIEEETQGIGHSQQIRDIGYAGESASPRGMRWAAKRVASRWADAQKLKQA